jgi:TRAP-type transport system periplasmic protein
MPTKTSFAGAALAALLAAAPAAAIDLNLVFLANTEDEEYDAALVFKNYVESRTAGEITVNIFPGAQLCGSANECFESMRAGVVDVYTATAGGSAAIYPPIQGFDIPYAFPGDRIAEATLRDPELISFVRNEVREATNGDILLLSLSQTGGWRNFANKDRQIKSPTDVAGLRLRTIESEIQQRLVREMGGSPTPLPFLEVYTALQTGVVDGTKNSITDITNMNFQEQLGHITLDGHAYMASMWFIGNGKFQQLTPEQQQVVLDGGAMMASIQFGIQPRKELDAWEKWTAAGGNTYAPTAEEMQAFRDAAAPIRDWYLEEFGADGEEFMAAFEAALARANEAVDADRATATATQ